MPHRTQQNGVRGAQQLDRIRGHHTAVAEVILRAPVKILKRKLHLVLAANPLQHALGLWDHFLAHAIARNYGNPERSH